MVALTGIYISNFSHRLFSSQESSLEAVAFLRLEGVTDPLSDDGIAAFEELSSEHLKQQLAGLVIDPTVSVANQQSFRRALRVLQDSESGIELECNLFGQSAYLDSEGFGKQARAAFNDETYQSSLMELDPAFEQLSNVAVSSTTSASEEDDDRAIDMPTEPNRGLQIGMIIAIIAGLIIALCSIAAGIYYLARSGSPSSTSVATPIQEYPVETNTREDEIVPEAPEKSDSVSVVIPKTSEVESSVNSDSRDPSAMKSIAGESDMEGFSVAAGAVDVDGGATISGTPSVGEGTGTSVSGDEMSSHAMSSLKQNMVSRTVIAPPGKLGIVIDTTLEGPIVHKVNGQSPLEGSLFPGDIIVAIDDVDTRAMSASAITALMVRTANLRRTLTVLTEENSA